jgi:hypothetical protein
MTTHEEVPVDISDAFLNSTFGITPYFFSMDIVHDFMQGEHPIHKISILNEDIPLDTKQLGSIRF